MGLSMNYFGNIALASTLIFGGIRYHSASAYGLTGKCADKFDSLAASSIKKVMGGVEKCVDRNPEDYLDSCLVVVEDGRLRAPNDEKLDRKLENYFNSAEKKFSKRCPSVNPGSFEPYCNEVTNPTDVVDCLYNTHVKDIIGETMDIVGNYGRCERFIVKGVSKALKYLMTRDGEDLEDKMDKIERTMRFSALRNCRGVLNTDVLWRNELKPSLLENTQGLRNIVP